MTHSKFHEMEEANRQYGLEVLRQSDKLLNDDGIKDNMEGPVNSTTKHWWQRLW